MGGEDSSGFILIILSFILTLLIRIGGRLGVFGCILGSSFSGLSWSLWAQSSSAAIRVRIAFWWR